MNYTESRYVPRTEVVAGVRKCMGHTVAQLVAALRYEPEGWGLGVRFPIVPLEIFIDIILPATLCLWDRLSLNFLKLPGLVIGM
jgi:hypothetical protein